MVSYVDHRKFATPHLWFNIVGWRDIRDHAEVFYTIWSTFAGTGHSISYK